MDIPDEIIRAVATAIDKAEDASSGRSPIARRYAIARAAAEAAISAAAGSATLSKGGEA